MIAQFEQAREARRRLQKVCDRLLHPGVKAFDASAEDLNGAIACLERLETALASNSGGRTGRQAIAAEIVGLSREVSKARALLETAGKFYAGWARLIDASPEETVIDYTSSGRSRAAISIDRGRVAMDG
jgi:excinuclease UvrABC nuclease subunit